MRNIITLLYEHYTKCYKELEELDIPFDEIKKYLYRKQIAIGLCYTAEKLLNSGILYNNMFLLEPYFEYEDHIAKRPNTGDSKEKVLHLLKRRIEVMEDIISKPEVLKQFEIE